ncbi:TPA: transposase [Bacillus wiedmannii]|nr:transposase [Bacillus wiedmannii]
MNPIISNELNLFAQELQYFLSSVVLQDIAKQVGFVQRSSKYQANELIALCVWISQEVASASLTHLCSQLEASTGVLMRSEGLNQRFNPAAVAFLREVFTSLLTQKLCSNHSLYSLRWQIEILFKTWKSFFEIDECKNIKRERLECHLYGQLIGILLCSSTMFQMRQFLLEKTNQELSEYKAIYMIKDYFPLLFQAIAIGTEQLLKILHRLYLLLKKNGRKCHRYKKMTVFDILGIVYKTTVKHRQTA